MKKPEENTSKKKSRQSKKKERTSEAPPKSDGSKWQEFLRRHKKAEEPKS